ncbi:MAG: prolipoprotein diacylglyceryl transferase [Pseudomonadota bacterium]|jgi:phosphatidylglycerol:prolipoprotein diacylglycerol transferase
MFINDAYLLTLDPFAIQLTATFGIRWYGLAYLVGFYCGYLLIRWFARRGISPIPAELAGDFVFTVALGTVIGGRLGYCLFYSPDLFLSFRSDFPFWGVLAINEGGMASHGGIIGIIIACVLFGRQHKLPAFHLFDLTTLGGTIGIFFGRIANFINGELVGRPAPDGYPLGVKFPQDILAWPGHEWARLETLAPAVEKVGVPSSQWGELLARSAADPRSFDTVTTVLHRIIDGIQGGSAPLSATLAPLLTTRYPSQLIEAGLEGLFLFVVLMLIWRIPRRPGVIAGWFFSLYAVVRIIGEQYRMPDLQIGYQLLGLTRGQWLSFAMLILGVIFLIVAARRHDKPLGGWGAFSNEIR